MSGNLKYTDTKYTEISTFVAARPKMKGDTRQCVIDGTNKGLVGRWICIYVDQTYHHMQGEIYSGKLRAVFDYPKDTKTNSKVRKRNEHLSNI